MEYCIIRPHNFYGIYQNLWDPYRNVLGIWMYQALNNLPLTIYGDGLQTRSFSYIFDSLPCLWNAAINNSAKNQIINLGAMHFISLIDAAKLMLKITNTTNLIHLEKRFEVKHAYSSYQKSIDILDYKETITLEHGIQTMWEWAKKQDKRNRTFFDKYELDINMYSYWKNL
jgi:UDP-glucose 4-epimerase